MTRKRTNPDFLNGVPELLILWILSQRPMYGYQLVQAIKRSSGGVLEFGEGCVYPILHRLEGQGLLSARRETVAGRNRVVYRATRAGRKQLAGSTAAWRRIVGATPTENGPNCFAAPNETSACCRSTPALPPA